MRDCASEDPTTVRGVDPGENESDWLIKFVSLLLSRSVNSEVAETVERFVGLTQFPGQKVLSCATEDSDGRVWTARRSARLRSDDPTRRDAVRR